ncbi:MAG: hypothetical protein PHO37_15820 [Kiritimatiellae bacterium]|nr:hypothetical protein [Kiritimatiellia bacterium]
MQGLPTGIKRYGLGIDDTIIYGIEMEVPDLARFGADILGSSAGVDYARPFVGFIVHSRNGNYKEARKE